MGLSLLLYLLLLLAGGIIGYHDLASEKLQGKLGKIQTCCLLFLLFTMGVRIGLDENVISSFFTIGFKAIVLCSFSVLFSVLFVKLVKNFIIGKKEGKTSDN